MYWTVLGEVAVRLLVKEALHVLGSELGEGKAAEVGQEVKAHDLAVARDGLGALRRRDHRLQPIFQESRDGLPVIGDRQALLDLTQGRRELLLDLLAGPAVQALAAEFAAFVAEGDLCLPSTIRALRDCALVLSPLHSHGSHLRFAQDCLAFLAPGFLIRIMGVGQDCLSLSFAYCVIPSLPQ